MKHSKIFAIRADANQKIATGHVMRCIPIAKELIKLNKKVLFITSDQESDAFVQQQGFDTIQLDGDCLDLDKEISELIETVMKYRIGCLLVDSFYVTIHYLSCISQYTRTIYFDYAHNFKCPAHGLINYDIRWDELHYENEPGEVKLLLGTAYAPLRLAFQNIALRKKDVSSIVENILVTSGGTDEQHFCEQIALQLAKNHNFNNTKIYVAIGSLFKNKDAILGLAKRYKNIKPVENADMLSLMENADIAITAGGVTCYELCACGVPSIIFASACQHIQFGRRMTQEKAMLYAEGSLNEKLAEKITCMVSDLAKNLSLRKKLSIKSQSLVDGQGACRIANELVSL